MIIVSQDKTKILNFDNIEVMGIGNPLETNDGKFKILVDTTNDNEFPIAEYETEERAKEVLQEIIKSYLEGVRAKAGNSLFGGFSFIPENALYEMPKE